jgi:hypothetical protein
MSAHFSVFKVGAAFAAVMVGFHLIWSVLVAVGWAQLVLDFVFWAHFIKPVYAIEPFEPIRAIALLALTAAVGFLLGLCAALVWNGLNHRGS